MKQKLFLKNTLTFCGSISLYKNALDYDIIFYPNLN